MNGIEDDGFHGADEFGEAPEDQTELEVWIDRRLERMHDLQAQARGIDEVAALRMEPIREWRDRETVRLRSEARYHEQVVEAAARRYDYGAKKSKSLPFGTIGSRLSRATVRVVDAVAALRFADENRLEVKRSVNVTPLLDHFTATGEVPDGCEYVPAEERYFVKVGVAP